VVATIPVGTQPVAIAYDSGKNQITVTNHGNNSVSVISDSENSVTATITVGDEPVGIAYDSGTSELYVTNHGDNTVTVIPDSLAPSASPGSVPEFSDLTPIFVGTTFVAIVFCAVLIEVKKRKLIGGTECYLDTVV
jgi:YVTN family beta-propeller protein